MVPQSLAAAPSITPRSGEGHVDGVSGGPALLAASDGRPDLLDHVGRPVRRGWSGRPETLIRPGCMTGWLRPTRGVGSVGDPGCSMLPMTGLEGRLRQRCRAMMTTRSPGSRCVTSQCPTAAKRRRAQIEGVRNSDTRHRGRSLKAATMPVAGAILVSLLVSVVIVRRRSRASASPEIHAQNASANCPVGKRVSTATPWSDVRRTR